MKKIFILLLISVSISINLFSQDTKKKKEKVIDTAELKSYYLDIETDKFTGQKRVSTSGTTSMKNGLSCGLGFGIRGVDNTTFLKVSGYGCGCFSIGEGDNLYIMLEDSSKLIIQSKSLQFTNFRAGGTTTYSHEYLCTLNDLKQLSTKNIIAIRRTNSTTYADIDIPERNYDKFKEAVNVFLWEFLKPTK